MDDPKHGPEAVETAILESIHIAKARRLPMRPVDTVTAEAGRGLVGDRYHGTRHRHVTLQSREELAAAAEAHGGPIDPGLTRRNLTIGSGRLPRRPGARICVGDVRLEVVRRRRALQAARGHARARRPTRALAPGGRRLPRDRRGRPRGGRNGRIRSRRLTRALRSTIHRPPRSRHPRRRSRATRRQRPARCPLVSALVLACLGTAALAAHAEETDVQAGTEVFVVSGAHGPRSATTIPNATTILDGDAIDTTISTSLDDLLRFVPGLQYTRQGAAAGAASCCCAASIRTTWSCSSMASA